jgi:cyanophycinase-like exopeptidase
VGVDEDTMAIITADNRMKVFGSHNVTVIGIANSTIGYATTYGVKRIIVQDPLIHNLTHEGEFDIQTRSKVLPEGFVPVYQQGFPLNLLSGNDRS